MAGFYIWETKPLEIQFVDDEDKPIEGLLDDVVEVIATISQPMQGAQIEKTMSQMIVEADTSTIYIHLSQAETSQFTPGEAKVQVNFLYDDSERDTSCQGEIQIWDNLHREVMA